MDRHKVNDLLKKFKLGILSEEENAFLEQWYYQYQETEGPDYQLEDRLADSIEIWQSLPVHHHRIKRKRLIPFVAAAASILFAVGSILYFARNDVNTGITKISNDIAAGKNDATITLPSGKVISLSESKSGVIVGKEGLSYNDGSKLAGGISKNQTDKTGFIKAQTPRGGMYHVILPDGTKVWLNAASTLKLPLSFVGLENRTVELEGEAYFEVFKNKKQPFIVKARNLDLTVIGTHFNVSAYADEKVTRATLLEGSIQVKSPVKKSHEDDSESVEIKPNEQVLTTNSGKLSVESVNAEETILWKNGKFSFVQEEMESVMRKIARWYDVEVIFNDPLQTLKLTGSISRYVNVSKLLEMLQNTKEVSFRLEGRKVYVSKYRR